MHTILKTGLCFFLFLFTTYAVAETTIAADTVTDSDSVEVKSGKSEAKQYYIVEVVLFKHLNEQGKQEEFWHQPNVLRDTEDFMSQSSIQAPSQEHQLNNISNDIPALAEYDMLNKQFSPLRNGIAALSKSNYKLADSAAHLSYSSNYQLLAHFGWTQRSLSQRSALPVLIKSSQFSDNLIPSGKLKLYVSRYLHIQVDLAASICEQIPVTEIDTDTGTGTGTGTGNELSNDNQCINNTYQFKQQRKMRSKELHYLDNPVYGMLVYVTPFTSEN